MKVLTHGPKPPDHPGTMEWPDWPFILRTYPAHEEGGERDFSVAVTGFSGSRRPRRENARCPYRAQRGQDDCAIEGTDFEIETDLVLLAIGYTGPVRDGFLEDLGLGYTERGAIPSQNGFGTSATPGVFVAGDAKRGVADRLGDRRGTQGGQASRRVLDGPELTSRLAGSSGLDSLLDKRPT